MPAELPAELWLSLASKWVNIANGSGAGVPSILVDLARGQVGPATTSVDPANTLVDLD
jgi:hypothetical protein